MISAEDILELAPDGGGWLRGGRPWTPPRPFYAVLGDPVDHSLSPVFQGAALRAEGMPFDYRAVRIDHGGLGRLLDGRADLGLAGFNVTAPHKRAVAGLCVDLSDEARRVDAVNTVRVDDAGWHGHATDPGGVAEVLRDGLEGRRTGAGVVLGAGGVATSALVALAAMGAARRVVLARSGPGLDALSAWRDAQGAAADDVELHVWSPDRPWPIAFDGVACVSALPRGVRGPALAAPGPDIWLDMNYGAGVEAPPGLPSDRFRDGRPVLLAQGALSFAWWFDRPAPRAIMANALASL